MKPEDPGSEVLEIGINKGHVGHLSGLRLGLEGGKEVEGREDPGK